MSEPDADYSRLAAWERREQPALAVLPYAMLGLCALVLAIVDRGAGTALLVNLGLSGLAGAWMLIFTLRRGLRDRTPLMAAYFAVLVVIMAILVIRIPWFGFYSFTGYLYAYWLRERWLRIAGVLCVALVTGTSQNGGLPRPHPTEITIYLLIVGVNMALASGFTWFAWVGSEQNERRKQLVAELSEANRRLQATLAENAALHQQLLTQAREAGIADERQRLAREIHDTLAQGLTGIITQLEAAQEAGESAERDRHVTAASRLARESLTEARRSVHELRPEPLEQARLPEALNEVTSRWSALHGIPAMAATNGVIWPATPDVEFALLRTAQEALANVARHASASRVQLTLSYMEDQVTLDVRDDGVGFSPDQAAGRAGTDARGAPGKGPRRSQGRRDVRGGGFGLTAMRERVEGLAGTLTIESGVGDGTAVSASIPVAAGSAATARSVR